MEILKTHISYKACKKLLLLFKFEIFLFSAIFFRLIFFAYNYPIVYWDEKTNLDVVNSTLNQSILFDLHYWGKPFFEKPPLWYMMTSVFVNLFSNNYLVYRLLPLLASLILVGIIFYLAHKIISKKAGIFALVFILSSSILFRPSSSYGYSSHTFSSADLDSLHLLFLTASFIFYSKFVSLLVSKKIFSFKALFIANFLIALSVLTKGPMGFLPIFLTLLFLVYKKVKLKFIFYFLILSLFLNLIFISWWYIFMYLKYGTEFLTTHFSYHIKNRVFSTLEGHQFPIYYYFEIFANPFEFLFGVIDIIAIFSLIKNKLYQKNYFYFVSIWGFVFVMIFLTFMQTKLSWYIFYTLPFAPWIFAIYIDLQSNTKSFA